MRDKAAVVTGSSRGITAQAVEHDPDLVFGREVPPGLPPDILNHPLRGGFHRRFFEGGGLGLHLRSFVTTTKPQPSLIHNLKSVPLVLTGDKGPVWSSEVVKGLPLAALGFEIDVALV